MSEAAGAAAELAATLTVAALGLSAAGAAVESPPKAGCRTSIFNYSMKGMIGALAKPGKGKKRNSTASQYAPVGQHLQHWLHNSDA